MKSGNNKPTVRNLPAVVTASIYQQIHKDYFCWSSCIEVFFYHRELLIDQGIDSKVAAAFNKKMNTCYEKSCNDKLLFTENIRSCECPAYYRKNQERTIILT